MKILQLLPTLNPAIGGVGPAVESLSRGLVGRGHEVDVTVLDDPVAPWLSHSDLTIHALGSARTGYAYSPKLNDWLRDHVREYDRVIVNGIWQYPSLAVWRHLRDSAIPYYVFPHGMLDPWFKRTYPLKHLKKWLYWPWAEYRVLRDAAAVIFTSEQERIEARESFWLYRAHEKVSPLGLETPPPASARAGERFLEKFPGARGKRMLLFLGRLHPKKGCDLAIEALAAVSGADDIVLMMAGPDQIGWQQFLEGRATQLGIERRVIFAGMLQGELKQGALTGADALLLPSHQENFGMAVVEALAAGVPVLMSNRVNTWREIEAEGAGYVAGDDLAGTVSLIERWNRTPPEQREMIRANARECFTRHFAIDRAVDSLLEVLREKDSS